VSRRSLWFVIASWALAVNFAGWVLLQSNDPDPVRWMAMYGATAVTSAAVPYWRRAWLVAVAVALVAAVWAALLWSGVVGVVETSDLWRKMSEKGGRVEEMREAGGLTIAAAWLAFSAVVGARRARAAP
jgi:tRNA(Ile2) C34 agmatinyltransferase TiaS